MRTARLLAVFPSMHCGGGMSDTGGSATGGMSATRGVCLLPGVSPTGGVSATRGGVSATGMGVCYWGGIPACTEAGTPSPWTEWQTGVKHNLRKLRLRVVKIFFLWSFLLTYSLSLGVNEPLVFCGLKYPTVMICSHSVKANAKERKGLKNKWKRWQTSKKLKCIPVGCVPSAAVDVCRGEECLLTGCLPRGCLPRGVSA